MRTLIIIVTLLITSITSTAFAETIANRFGFSGRIGLMAPLEDAFIKNTDKTDAGFAATVGVIYGFNDHLAAEFEYTSIPKLDVDKGGAKFFEVWMHDISIGLQYRILPKSTVVPYIGAGVDFIRGNAERLSDGKGFTLDWTYGGHVNAGVDWFLTKGIALTADVRAVMADKGEFRDSSPKAEYDPYWVQGTFGVRLMLPEKF